MLAQEPHPGPEQQKRQVPRGKPFDHLPPLEVQRQLEDALLRGQVADAVRGARSKVQALLTEAAANFGQRIQPASMMFYAGLDGAVAASVALEGFDKVGIKDLAHGIDALFVFISPNLSSAVPAGFYLVQVRGAGNQFLAEFRTRDGRTVYQAPAIVTQARKDNARMEPMCTIGPHGELILFDYHDAVKEIWIETKRAANLGNLPRTMEGPALGIATVAQQILSVLQRTVSRSLLEKNFVAGVFSAPSSGQKEILMKCDKPGGGKEWCRCEMLYRPHYVYAVCVGFDTGNIYAYLFY